MCLDCASIEAEFFCDGFGFECIWEDLRQHIVDMNGKISSDCLVRLTKSARDDVCDLIEEYWEESDED